jgi:hypothetical protein
MDLLLAASRAFDRLLLALINGYGDLASPAPVGAPDAVAIAPSAASRSRRPTRLARDPA